MSSFLLNDVSKIKEFAKKNELLEFHMAYICLNWLVDESRVIKQFESLTTGTIKNTFVDMRLNWGIFGVV